MKIFEENRILVLSVAIGWLLVPILAFAEPPPGGCITCSVPEPATLALLGAGLAWVGGAALSRRRKDK